MTPLCEHSTCVWCEARQHAHAPALTARRTARRPKPSEPTLQSSCGAKRTSKYLRATCHVPRHVSASQLAACRIVPPSFQFR